MSENGPYVDRPDGKASNTSYRPLLSAMRERRIDVREIVREQFTTK